MLETHKEQRIRVALEFLTQYNEEGDSLLQRIVTSDESWMHYWTPEMKRASMVWKTADENAPQKFKEKPSAGKMLATVFWDCHGIIHLKYCPKGTTITAASYFDTLMQFWNAIKQKQPGLLSQKVFFFAQ